MPVALEVGAVLGTLVVHLGALKLGVWSLRPSQEYAQKIVKSRTG